VQFIGLNPSVATDEIDDPTIRKCRKFANTWGYGKFCMTNIFAWRDTDPKLMKLADEPIGPDNDHWLTTIAAGAGMIVAAWGNHGLHRGRDKEVVKLIQKDLLCLFVNRKTGQPKHPLYLRDDTKPFPYVAT
jgi:hypothetical protein